MVQFLALNRLISSARNEEINCLAQTENFLYFSLKQINCNTQTKRKAKNKKSLLIPYVVFCRIRKSKDKKQNEKKKTKIIKRYQLWKLKLNFYLGEFSSKNQNKNKK